MAEKKKTTPASKSPAKQSAKNARPAAKGKAKPAVKTKPQPAAKAMAKPAAKAKPLAQQAAASRKPKQRQEAGSTSLLNSVKRVASKVAQAAAGAALKVIDADAGRPAPAFDLLDERGEHVSSSSLGGKPYLLYFYPKDDTPGCTKEACDIRDNFGRFGQQGVRVLGVSPDSQKSHAKFGQKYGLPFTLLSDPDKTLAKAYGVWGTKQNYGKEYLGIIRSTFLIGADGRIKKAYRGVKVDGHVSALLNDAKELL